MEQGVNRMTAKTKGETKNRVQVNVCARVNSASIRRETHNGREHWVIPSYTLPANVIMNGGLYPASEIDAHYKKLEGTLAPLGHPKVNGQFVSAFSPEGINVGHIGAWNRNVKKSGNRIYAEKWLDVERAKESEGGRELLARLEALEKGEDVPPIHTSVAVFLERIEANEEQRAAGYEWIAKIHDIDHDAILLNEVGAATPEQGVGLMVNAEDARPLIANAGVLAGISYRDRERILDEAARRRWVQSDNDYAYVVDFNDEAAIIVRSGAQRSQAMFEYKIENGTAVFADEGVAVEQQTTWVEKLSRLPAVNKIIEIFNRQVRPGKQQEGDMPLTAEEKAELVRDIGSAVVDQVNSAIAEALKPLSTKMESLEANQKTITDTVTANAKAEEAKMREAVAAKFGEVVANSLTGEPLVEMYKQCGDAAPVAPGGVPVGNSAEKFAAPDPANYGGLQ